MVVPRRMFFRRVTRDEASVVVGGVVEAWRMKIGWDNGLLTLGHDGWCRLGRWGGCGKGGSRGRTCGRQRRSLMGGGLIIIIITIVMRLIDYVQTSVVETSF